MLKEIRNAVADYFFPPMCILCKEVGKTFLCENCVWKIEKALAYKKIKPSGGTGYADEGFYVFEYNDEDIKRTLISMKRNGYEGIYIALRPYIEKALIKSGYIEKCDAVVYCPRAIIKKRKYDTDQAYDIAKVVSEIADLPFRKKAIKRRFISFSQHLLPENLRRINIKGKFRCTERFDGQNVILIDDIVTTGSTTSEVAHILKKNGAMKVFVFAVAH